MIFGSYLPLQLGNISATVLEKNNSVCLPDSFHYLLLFCHTRVLPYLTFKLPSLLSPSLRCVGFCSDQPFSNSLSFDFYLQVSISVFSALIEKVPSPKQPQIHLDGVTKSCLALLWSLPKTWRVNKCWVGQERGSEGAPGLAGLYFLLQELIPWQDNLTVGSPSPDLRPADLTPYTIICASLTGWHPGWAPQTVHHGLRHTPMQCISHAAKAPVQGNWAAPFCSSSQTHWINSPVKPTAWPSPGSSQKPENSRLPANPCDTAVVAHDPTTQLQRNGELQPCDVEMCFHVCSELASAIRNIF